MSTSTLYRCSEDSHLGPHFPKLLGVTGDDVHDHPLLSYPFHQLDMLVLYTKQRTLNSCPVFIEVDLASSTGKHKRQTAETVSIVIQQLYLLPNEHRGLIRP